MDYIEKLRKLNISFNEIDEHSANSIMYNQYSFYRLLEYTVLFEKYRIPEKQNTFVSLDFSQLYYLAHLDTSLSVLLMKICLDIEQRIKTRLLYDIDMHYDSSAFLTEYYESDKEYLDQTYRHENIQMLQDTFLSTSINELDLHSFLEIAQFGTIEKMYNYFSKYYISSLTTDINLVENGLDSVRRVRNIVAHNNSIIAKSTIISDEKCQRMRSFLGNHGIKSRQLKTNMSKQIICDIVNVLYIAFTLTTDKATLIRDLKDFDLNYCQKYGIYYNTHNQLKSYYQFLKSVITIFSKTSD